MKKLLILFAVISISTIAFGQTKTGYGFGYSFHKNYYTEGKTCELFISDVVNVKNFRNGEYGTQLAIQNQWNKQIEDNYTDKSYTYYGRSYADLSQQKAVEKRSKVITEYKKCSVVYIHDFIFFEEK